jgi:hypothetical protein
MRLPSTRASPVPQQVRAGGIQEWGKRASARDQASCLLSTPEVRRQRAIHTFGSFHGDNFTWAWQIVLSVNYTCSPAGSKD